MISVEHDVTVFVIREIGDGRAYIVRASNGFMAIRQFAEQQFGAWLKPYHEGDIRPLSHVKISLPLCLLPHGIGIEKVYFVLQDAAWEKGREYVMSTCQFDRNVALIPKWEAD